MTRGCMRLMMTETSQQASTSLNTSLFMRHGRRRCNVSSRLVVTASSHYTTAWTWGVDPWEIWSSWLSPPKICRRGQNMLWSPKNVTFFHSKLLLDNSASFTSSRMKDFCQKWKVKLIFRGAWNSLMAWSDWSRPVIFYDRSAPLRQPTREDRISSSITFMEKSPWLGENLQALIRLCRLADLIICTAWSH